VLPLAADFALQVPRELYEFPAFPYPEDKAWAKFPKGPEVQEYVELFADHFSLHGNIRFNTKVVSAEPLGSGWSVSFVPASSQDEKSSTESFDFLVVATGMYSGASPHMPAHPGRETFKGDILHSFDFKERTQAYGKRVVVVGGGKSAVDCAVAAVKGGAQEATLVFRDAHWPVPRLILGLIPFKLATYSRLGHGLLPTHYDVSASVGCLHALVKPLKWLVWRLVERIFAFQFALSKEMTPSSRIEIDVFSGGQILTYEARDMIKAGDLKVCKNSIATYTASGVDLLDGASIACDLVVYGTGFAKNYAYFNASTQAKLQLQKDGLYLYRSMLPVGVPSLAFLGSEVSTFNNILTQGLQAAWLSKVLSGKISLPPPCQMHHAVETEMRWKRAWMPSTSARAAIQQLHMPKYHDQLVADMGLPTCRKSNPLFELLMPYNARDYCSVFDLPDHTVWKRLKSALAFAALFVSSTVMMLVARPVWFVR
jgi:cation diffusion facilitator CzcD-associated flavoprotein CzcO